MKQSGGLAGLMERYREILLYVVFGFLATVVSVATYWLCVKPLHIDVLIANVVSWICAVLFAFFTNRKWVFNADSVQGKGLLAQMASFFGGRLFTLAVEEAILAVFVTWLKLDSLAVKLVAQFVVIVLNYFISKFWVFKKEKA